MPIKNLSNVRQMPRLGKVRTGVKVPNKSGQGEHPEAVEWFVLPPEIASAFGEKPKSLPIMFPVEDDTKFASQYYKCYSSFRGLTCKGDGEVCSRLIDTKTGDFAHRDTTDTDRRELPCNGRDCPMYQQKKCKEVMNLQFLLPSVPGLGVWQLDTGSYHSIVAVNSAIELIRSVAGRIAMIPLTLTIEPREVSIKTDKGQVKKTVSTLQIRTDITLAEIQRLGAMPASQVMLPPPDEEKPDMLFSEDEGEEAKPSTKEPISEKEIAEMWDGKKNTPTPAAKPAEKQPVAQSAEQTTKPVEVTETKQADTGLAGYVDTAWLNESLAALKWKLPTFLSFFEGNRAKLGLTTEKITGKTAAEAVSKLNQEQAKKFTDCINDMLRLK